MTIFLHGADGYRRTHRLKEALRQFLAKYPGVGVRRLDAELDDDPAGKANDIFGSTSLFSPRTLVVLDSALTIAPKELAALVDRTAKSETQHLILVATADKVTKPYARLTEEDVNAQVFPVLTGGEWATFVAREAKARDLELSRPLLQQLTYAFPGDSWGVTTELDTLAAMPEAQRATRIAQTARAGAIGSPSWTELRKLGSGPFISRLIALAYIEASGDDAAKSFAMAAYTASPLAAADGDLAVKTGGWGHEEALVSLALH